MTAAPLSSLPYRPGVGIMLVNGDRQVFAAKRADMRTEAWQMPQGGIDEGETPHEAALRELEEETGTAKAEIIAESRDWYHYDLPTEMVPRIWGGRYRGQRQKWFVMRFLGVDSDIDIHTAHPEFVEWQWTRLEDLPGLIVPFKRPLYEALVAEFGSVIRG